MNPSLAPETTLTRRQALTRAGTMLGAAVAGSMVQGQASAAGAAAQAAAEPFLFCLNTATIRGNKLGLRREIEIAAEAGYQGIEPWMDSIDAYVKEGGSLKELSQRLKDLGLTVESAIGFPHWIVDDDADRAKGLEQARREMDKVAQLGGKRFAAPPAGATDKPGLDLLKAAERYRALLEVGDQIGVVPQVELWGFSRNLSRLGECVCVAMETGHPKACVLADVFHLHKGGSDFRGMHLLGSEAIQVLHMNDYPAEPSRARIDDSFRAYPGDGVAPVVELLRALHASGGRKVLSLELFNRLYWTMNPLDVARNGLAKMKAVAKRALQA